VWRSLTWDIELRNLVFCATSPGILGPKTWDFWLDVLVEDVDVVSWRGHRLHLLGRAPRLDSGEAYRR